MFCLLSVWYFLGIASFVLIMCPALHKASALKKSRAGLFFFSFGLWCWELNTGPHSCQACSSVLSTVDSNFLCSIVLTLELSLKGNCWHASFCSVGKSKQNCWNFGSGVVDFHQSCSPSVSNWSGQGWLSRLRGRPLLDIVHFIAKTLWDWATWGQVRCFENLCRSLQASQSSQ